MLLALLLAFGPPPVIHGGDVLPSYRCSDDPTCVNRTLPSKLSDIVSVRDKGALANGSHDDSSAINKSLLAHNGVVLMPASSSCYNIGSTTIVMQSGRTLAGEGYGSPGNGATCITYTGSSCAILFESVRDAAVLNLDVHVNSASASAAGICFAAGTSNPEFNRVENVSITADQVRVVGQVGLWMEDTGAGIYWNTFKTLRFKSWDTALLMHATGTVNGVNDNKFYDLMSYGMNNAWVLRAGNKQVTDNKFFGLSCSRSDGTLTTNVNCLLMGDDNVTGVFANNVFGVDCDMGAPSVCGVLGTTTGANLVIANSNSGGGVQDNGVAAFANSVWNVNAIGSLVNQLAVGNIKSTRGGSLVLSAIAGIAGGGTAGAGGTLPVRAGAGNANLAGGDLQLFGGDGGSGTAVPGNALLSPGTRAGSTNGGTTTVGPAPALGASGVRVRSSRVIMANKPFTTADCAAANPAPTVSAMLETGAWTCGTAQTFTTPTFQGAAGIIQGLPGNGVAALSGGPAAVGDLFEVVTLISTAAANFTFAVGAGGTIKGNPVVNNATKTWRCKITSVASGSETADCF